MKMFLFKLVALASGMTMALPPGWCCGALRAERESNSTRKTCCHRRGPIRPSDSGSRPAQPNVQCCCSRDGALPAKRVQHSDAPVAAAPAVFCDVVSDPDTFGREADVFPLLAAPPPHVFQCVWRCWSARCA